MADAARETWITGIGIVSSLGEGPQAHWQKLMEAQPGADASAFAPFLVHPLAPINFDAQIPKKGDQRQMEMWQRIGTYAAGLALDSAGVKGQTDILSRMDMIVAAGGGERDLAVDGAILTGMPKAANPAAFLNERLMSDLRPTLFLAQLSNLAGRQYLDRAWRHRLIANVHGRGIVRRERGADCAVAHRRGPERYRAGRRLA